MSLASTTALLSVLLIVLSQVQRRTDRFNPVLPIVVRVLVVTVLGLVAYYFYGRFVA